MLPACGLRTVVKVRGKDKNLPVLPAPKAKARVPTANVLPGRVDSVLAAVAAAAVPADS